MTGEILVAAALVLAVATLHYALGRVGRRLPRWLAARRGVSFRPQALGTRAVAIGALAGQVLVWSALALVLSDRFAALHRVRDLAAAVLHMSVTAPLFTLGERAYSLRDLLALPVLLIGVWLAVGGFVRLIRAHVLRPAGVEVGAQETLSALLRYALSLLGALIVLQAWGVDVRTLAILASVLGVGIGFGLQNIANNFVSGLLVNLGRAVRPGDFVKVGEYTGTVRRVGPRSTEIETLDRVTIFVPNSRFLETEVVNWSHADPTTRVHVPVGVAYGSDPHRVRAALLEAARGHTAVLREPPPQVQLRRFGESSLDFELLVWTRDPRYQQTLESDLNYRVVESLGRHRIAIPFPQRDLHLRSPALEAALEAWRQRVAPGPEPGSLAAGPAPMAADAASDPHADEDQASEGLDGAEVDALIERMRGPTGISIRDRRHLLATYPRCFVGREAVDWLVRNEGLSRPEAVALGERLAGLGKLRHVLDEHGFRDGHFFYRFRADEAS